MAATITRAIPHALIIPFDWSGDNSHSARIAAGCELQDLVHQLALQYPGSTIAIIAHSHGGNVVLYALRDGAVAHLVSDVVFLGTPFFRFVPRSVRHAVRLFVTVVGFIVFVMAGYIIWFSITTLNSIINSDFLAIITVLSTFIVILPVIVTMTYFAKKLSGRKITRLLIRRRAMLMRRLSAPPLPVRGLVCRSPADEAYLYLLGLATITSTPFFIWSVIVTCTRSIPLIILALILARCEGDSFVAETDAFVSENSLYIAAFGVASLYPVALVATFALILVLAVTRGNRWAFGWTGLLGAVLVDVRPVPLPRAIGNAAVSLLSGVKRPRGILALFHSGYYSDLAVLEKIVSFVRGLNVGESVSRADESVQKLVPYTRWSVVGAAVAISAIAMLRYDYIQQQQAVREKLPETESLTEAHSIFATDITGLSLGPSKSHTEKFNFQKMVVGQACHLVGDYRSSGSRLEVLIHVVRLTKSVPPVLPLPPLNAQRSIGFPLLSGPLAYRLAPNGPLVQVMDWYASGGERLVPPKYPPPKGPPPKGPLLDLEPDLSEKVRIAILNNAAEAEFPREVIRISRDHPKQKHVHFERALVEVAAGDVGGVLARNEGATDSIEMDLVISIVCGNHREAGSKGPTM